jgi:hypothetical protein
MHGENHTFYEMSLLKLFVRTEFNNLEIASICCSAVNFTFIIFCKDS